MRDDSQKYRLFTRRSFILSGINILLTSTVVGRYLYLQLIEGSKYKDLSEKNHIKLQVVPAPRGRFLDRIGQELANEAIVYNLGILPSHIKAHKEIIAALEIALGRKLNLSADDLKRRLLKRNRTSPLILEYNLSWQDLSTISEKIADIPGAESISQPVRNYIYPEQMAHVTGYIAAANNQDINQHNLTPFNDIKIGKAGLEKYFDASLRGKVGFRKTEVNVNGKVIQELGEDPYERGEDLKLTIDHHLQLFVHEIMQAREANGAVIVMKAQTGEILALHSMPSFNPNKFTNGVSAEEWRALLSNTSNPLINNAISIPYPPGSTFKLITALAILASGVDPKRKVHCTGHFEMGGHDFKCWKAGGHGSIDLYRAIAESCNPYFYHMGLNIGIEAIAKVARTLGYGQKTDIELPYENKGLVPDEKWKMQRFGMPWFKGDTVNISIGQGAMLATPIQIAQMTARLMTNRAIKPSLILRDKYEFPELQFNPEHLHIVRTGMMLSCNSPGGVMTRHNMKETGFMVGGKTGTAQVVDLQHKNKTKNFAHHALFTGYVITEQEHFAQLENAEYIITVVVAHGEAGAKSAGPIAKQIALKLAGKRTQLDIIDEEQELIL